jgi:hypothetical protein
MILGTASSAEVAIVRLDYSNAPGFELRDNSGVPLTPGNLAVAQDGAVIQIGYYTLATTSDPFAGDWVPMIGPGLGSGTFSTIGDKGALAGLFSGNQSFGETPLGPYTFPSIGTLISLRFYDATTVAGSAHFNAVSSTNWIWTGATDPEGVISVDMTNSTLLWQDGLGSAFRTTIPVPEPGGTVLLAVAMAASTFSRKRSSS